MATSFFVNPQQLNRLQQSHLVQLSCLQHIPTNLDVWMLIHSKKGFLACNSKRTFPKTLLSVKISSTCARIIVCPVLSSNIGHSNCFVIKRLVILLQMRSFVILPPPVLKLSGMHCKRSRGGGLPGIAR